MSNKLEVYSPGILGDPPILLHEFNEVNSVSIEYFRIGVESYNHQHASVCSEETLRAHVKIITLFFVRLKKLERKIFEINQEKGITETSGDVITLQNDCFKVQLMLKELYFLLNQPVPENILSFFSSQK